MRLLIYMLIAGAICLGPFVLLRRPWAVRFWNNIRLVAMVYAVIILLVALLGLVLRWDEIYG